VTIKEFRNWLESTDGDVDRRIGVKRPKLIAPAYLIQNRGADILHSFPRVEMQRCARNVLHHVSRSHDEALTRVVCNDERCGRFRSNGTNTFAEQTHGAEIQHLGMRCHADAIGLFLGQRCLAHQQQFTRWLPNFTLKLVRPGLRPAGRAGCVLASVTASRRLQLATRFFERHRRQPPRRSCFGT
jgi:hypothetical protein